MGQFSLFYHGDKRIGVNKTINKTQAENNKENQTINNNKSKNIYLLTCTVTALGFTFVCGFIYKRI